MIDVSVDESTAVVSGKAAVERGRVQICSPTLQYQAQTSANGNRSDIVSNQLLL
jgi:hypothetical protein